MRFIIILFPPILLSAGVHSLCADDPPKPGVTAPKRKPNFTISKETTYVTGPVADDGYIDYVAALNNKLSEGVTTENNAVVLLWKAFGPRTDGTTMPPEFFKLLGIESPPETGDYFVSLEKFAETRLQMDVEERGKLYDRIVEARKGPWKPAEYPEIAAWLKAVEQPLRLVAEASKRPHYYSPYASNSDNRSAPRLISVILPGVQSCRMFANALTARAMLRLDEGNVEAAWQDLLTCHRLGRLITRGGMLIEGLVGLAIDGIACSTEVHFLAHANLRTDELKSCLHDLKSLPPIPHMAEVVSLGDRFMFLDCIMALARGGFDGLDALGEAAHLGFTDPITKAALNTVHWDKALRNANYWYDRSADIMRVKSHSERKRQWQEMEDALRKLKEQSTSAWSVTKFYLGGYEARGEVIGNVLISFLMPAVWKVSDAADRNEQVQHNLHFAFALAIYRREHGRYPEKLDLLAPKYLAEIPKDVFSGNPVIYQPDANGYLLHSVGLNGVDDGGKFYGAEPPGDDVGFRMPPAKEKKNQPADGK